MSMERQDYPAMLPQLQPPQAVNILSDRVQQVGRLNVAIADWLQERRRLEEQYSAGLRKLAHRQLDAGDLGIFSVPWTTLTGSADTLAESHSALATKIEVDVERPLRDFTSTNREMTQMSTIQGNLVAMAKDVERAQQKTDKLKVKGEKADPSKVGSANLDLDTAQTQWESQAPYVFENLQALDETRLNHLRDVLTQFQTHEVDQVERSRITAEQCLNVLLNIETADEIKTFALKSMSAKPSVGRSQRNSIATPSRAIQPGPSMANPGGLTPISSTPDDETRTERSGSIPEDKKSRLKGLKRLGTVMGRKRESKLPSNLPSTSESPERRQRPSAFSSMSRFGRSRENTPTLDALQESPRGERPGMAPQLGSEIFSPQTPQAETPRAQPRNLGSAAQYSEPPHVNGTTLAALNGSHQGDLSEIEPPKPAQPEPAPQLVTEEAQKDSEGFSVPPQSLDPISQAQQEAALADEGGSSPYNVNIRDAPIQEDGANSEAALASLSNRLQAPPTTTRRAGTVRGRRQDRNSAVPSSYAPAEQSINEYAPETAESTARDVVEPTPIQPTAPAVQEATGIVGTGLVQSSSAGFGSVAASTFSPFSPAGEQGSPSFPKPESRSATGTDNQSIRSATTTGSQGGAKHPDLHETGLNTSIIETVNARFESGKLASSSLIGEIALAYNPPNFSSPFGNENIRLDNFANLEKVAPNPAFITSSPDKQGEYSVNLATLGKTQVAFKYQVQVDEAESQAPLLITPAFRPEQNQFSAIVSYSLNPQFALHGRESITLSNVMLAFTLEGAKATSCLSKPVGNFAREKNLIYWQLNDITLTPGTAPEKLLARFATESEAKSGSIEARWEVSGANAQGLGSRLNVSAQSHSTAGAGDSTDPFADESTAGGWKAVPGVKKLTSGSYLAK